MKPFRRETLFYIIAFVLALAVRVTRLGTWPLTDFEASWALQALHVAQGTHPVLGSQTAYVLLTSIAFFLYGGGTNFLARLIPALVGSSLVFVPFLFRDRIRPRPSAILAFFLALDPGLVALSREAGSSILALTFFLAAWGFWENKNSRLAGVFAGLTLLSGPALWQGLLGLGLTWAIRQAWDRASKTEAAEGEELSVERPARSEWISALWFGAGTIVLGGSLFFPSANGLSAGLSSLPDYLSNWRIPSGFSAGYLLFSLIAYQPLAVILGLVAAIRGWMQNGLRARRLSIWAVVALLLALFYPGHTTGNLIWVLVPLWALAAMELTRNLTVFEDERMEVLGVIGLVCLVTTFAWLDFITLAQTPIPSDQATLRIWLLFGAFFMLVVSVLLVAVGWSMRSARLGVVWGMVVVLGVFSFGAMLGAGGLRVTPGAELWNAGAVPVDANLVQMTVDQTSDVSMGTINAQPVTIAGISSAALEWVLRNHQVQTTALLDASTSPAIVITTGENNPSLAAGYRGQSLTWRQTPLWNNAIFTDWMSWFAFHQMPSDKETIIVWVRNDLFLDANSTKP